MTNVHGEYDKVYRLHAKLILGLRERIDATLLLGTNVGACADKLREPGVAGLAAPLWSDIVSHTMWFTTE